MWDPTLQNTINSAPAGKKKNKYEKKHITMHFLLHTYPHNFGIANAQSVTLSNPFDMTKLLEFVQLVFHQSQIHNVLSTPLILLLPVTGLKKVKAKLPPK